MYLSQTNRWDFFQALRTVFSTTIVASDWCIMQTYGWSMVGSIQTIVDIIRGQNWSLWYNLAVVHVLSDHRHLC